MAVPVSLPVPEGSSAARLVEWYRPDGAELQPGDPVVCVEAGDIVFDIDAEAAGILHHQVAPGEDPLPSNIIAFIAAPGEELPEVPPPGQAPVRSMSVEPEPFHSPVADFVPGAPIPLRRGALGPPKEFSRGGAWDRVFGSSEDGHIDDLWPHTEAPAAAHGAARAPVADEPPPSAAIPAYDEPSGDIPFSLGEAVAGQSLEELDDPEPFGVAAPWDPGVEDSAEEPASEPYRAPGIEVSPAEVFGGPSWLDAPRDVQGFADSTQAAVAAEPMAWAETAPVYIPPPPLILRGTIRMTEARKLCDQLGREWKEAPARPENEDLVLRAVARAAAERDLAPPDGGAAGLVIPLAGGDRIAVLRGAGRGSFKEQVARLNQSSRDSSYADCGVTLVSFRHFGIEEATPLLPEGHSVAFAMGALRPGAAAEGDVPVPVMVLTMAYNPDVLSMGDAALLFARTGELVEAPYALLAD